MSLVPLLDEEETLGLPFSTDILDTRRRQLSVSQQEAPTMNLAMLHSD